MKVSSDFVPEKFKDLYLNKGSTAPNKNQEQEIVPIKIDEDFSKKKEENKIPSKKKDEIESSIDFLQQRQVKSTEPINVTRSIPRKTADEQSSEDLISSMVIYENYSAFSSQEGSRRYSVYQQPRLFTNTI